jgi:multidrug efflux system membrane fusion protein
MKPPNSRASQSRTTQSRTTFASPCSVGILAVAVAMLALLGGCRSRTASNSQAAGNQAAGNQAGEQGKKEPAQITVENGQTYITLDEPTQKRLGFILATLASTTTRAQATLPAVVLSVQELASSRNAYIAAQAQLQKARLQAGVAGKEYARLKTLYGDEQNISEKSLQAAEAALQSDEADVGAAGQQLNLQASAIRQEWGPVATGWVTEGSAQLQRALDGTDALIQLTVPGGAGFAAPKTVSLELPGGVRRQASLVSAFPRLDPRIQGRSYLYRASGQPGLSPGLNLVARLPVGGALQGVVIPASAVVWSEGRAWVYTEVSAGRFSRSPVATDVPVDNGFFAAQGFSPGDKIVTVGAQALLSEEMLLHSQSSGDEN